MKTLFMKSALMLMAIGLFALPGMAQSISNQTLKTGMIADWERAKAYTKEYLDAMPEKGINFKPTPEMRSFAEQMLHLAQANMGLSGNGTGQKPLYGDKNLEKMEEYKSKEPLSKIVMESYDFVISGIKKMDESKFSNKVTMESFKVTASQLDWIYKTFEHQTHHRGQCTVYLRLMGVTPPQEKLF